MRILVRSMAIMTTSFLVIKWICGRRSIKLLLLILCPTGPLAGRGGNEIQYYPVRPAINPREKRLFLQLWMQIIIWKVYYVTPHITRFSWQSCQIFIKSIHRGAEIWAIKRRFCYQIFSLYSFRKNIIKLESLTIFNSALARIGARRRVEWHGGNT